MVKSVVAKGNGIRSAKDVCDLSENLTDARQTFLLLSCPGDLGGKEARVHGHQGAQWVLGRRAAGPVGPKRLFPPMQPALNVTCAKSAPARVERLVERRVDSPFSGD